MSTTSDPPMDLSACETERLGRIGLVQPFGGLIVFERDGRTLAEAGSVGPLRPFANRLGSLALEERPVLIEGDGPSGHEILAHRIGDAVVLELLRPTERPTPGFLEAASAARDALRRLKGENVFRCAQAMAERVRELTRYDRVMVYRFHRDWSGEVIAECRKPGATPYLGLRYPASDIPAQARDLYLRNLIRVVGDADGVDHILRPSEGHSSPDLSMAILRAPSRYHVEYLRNMGVVATLTVSIIREGRLWGMLACHHDAPRFPPFGLREACRAMVEVFETLLDDAEASLRAAVQRQLSSLAGKVDAAPERLAIELLFSAEGRMAWQSADGLALSHAGHVAGVGLLPPPDELRRLIDDTPRDGTLVRDRIRIPRAMPWLPTPVGICARRGERDTWVGLFRGEVAHQIVWGGDPARPAEPGPDGRPSPRRSFAAWRETVRGASKPWTDDDLGLLEGLLGLLENARDLRAFGEVRLLPDDEAMSPPRLVAPHVPAILFDGMTAETKTVAHVTPAFVALTGLAPDETIGRHWRSLGNALPFLGEQAEPGDRADAAAPIFSRDRGTVFLRHRAETALLLLGDTEHWLDVVVLEDASLETNLARALRAATQAGEAAERTRNAVLRTISHELRTPLNAIIGFAQLLMTPGDLDKATIGDFATEIHSAGQDLLRMVDRVIETARLQGGKVPIRPEDADLAEIVRETTRRLQPVFEKANVHLVADRLPSVRLRTDPALARQVLTDILENAVKFSPANGVVTVTVAETPDFGWIEVEDQGPGIPEEHKRRVFQPFEQGDAAVSRTHGGLGLGLHLALTTTGLLGGVLRHRNTGRGSRFQIGLPRVAPNLPPGRG